MKKLLTITLAIVVSAFVGTSLSSYAQQKKTGTKRPTTTVQKKPRVQSSGKSIKRDTVRYKGEYSLRSIVIFNMGRSVVKGKWPNEEIKKIADYANEYKDCKILIEGICYEWDFDVKSEQEKTDIQFKISERRANAVKDVLIKEHNIDENRITTKSLGFRIDPVVSDEPLFNRAALIYAIP